MLAFLIKKALGRPSDEPLVKGTAGKVLNFIGEVGGSGSDYPSPSKSDEWSTTNNLSAKQEHDMDSNGLSRSEAINNPNW
ncbi:MAG: hypothetical protein DSY43_04380 [Gammaproteobacteria bacterium]|nr:MAG: hypothetical protein DSY43_04380 [Gammaproteobacteria bacterium]